MDFDHQNLKDNFKQILKAFRFKLLLYDLFLMGGIIGFSILLFILFYYCFSLFFSFSVLGKTVYYFLFLIVISVECLLFLFYPVFRFVRYSFYENDLLLFKVLKLLPFQSDIFVSVYNLSFHANLVNGDEQLKQAAFIQKYNYLVQNNLLPIFPLKLLFRKFLFFLFFVLVFACTYNKTSALYEDLRNYKVIIPRHVLLFSIQNESLNVEYGKDFKLSLKVNSDAYQIDRVFICFGGGEFLMTQEDSVFTYNFEAVNNNLKFNFKTFDQQSEIYEINVLPSPVITAYKVTLSPPSYTGLKSEIQVNTVDFRVLYGSKLKFDLNLADLDSLYISDDKKLSVIPLKDPSFTDFLLNIDKSGEYSFLGSNSHFSLKNLLNFTITCIPDLYPGIQVSEIQDSLHNSVHYFYGVITDDYGFSALRFNYSVNTTTNTVVSIPVVKNNKTQEFYFNFDFAEFAGMDESEISYFFEVFDNDVISGPKSTHSDQKLYKIPDLNTIFEYNVEVNNTVNNALNEVEKVADEIVSGVKDLQKKMLDNTVDNWEKQQLSKDIVQKKEKLDQLLQKVKQENLKKSDLNKSFTNQDSILIDKQQKIQDLLDRVMDDEMKDLMKEFSKLSEEFSKERFKNLDEKMKLTFDQMSEELDRNLELLKRFQIEEQHDLLLKQLNKLKSDQKEFTDMQRNSSLSKDSLTGKSNEIKNNFENIQDYYRDLLDKNNQLAEPYSLNQLKDNFEQLSNNIDKQSDNSKEGKKNNTLSDQVKKEIDDISEELKKQHEQNFVNKSLPQNDIELLIQNILIISLSEEELLKEFSNVEVQSLKYNELGRLQDLKRQEYKIVKDSLSVLAKSNLVLASLLSHKFYDIEIKFGLLPGYIQDNRRGELAKEQQYIITYLNDMALSLTEALQKEQRESDASGDEKQGSDSGKGKKEGSSKGSKSGYDGMKKFQQGLKKQLEELVANMKKGEKGKPLQEGISNMIRENELFRKNLNDFISNSGSLSNLEKKLLNEINQLLDQNIKDLANYSVSNQLINRNSLIFNNLIISEKASQEREEFDDKRKSESAQEMKYKRPEVIFNTKNRSGLIKTDFRKSDLKLNDYFKNMFNNYYIRLGDE